MIISQSKKAKSKYDLIIFYYEIHVIIFYYISLSFIILIYLTNEIHEICLHPCVYTFERNTRDPETYYTTMARPPIQELLELAFDDTFVKPFQWSSFAQAYSRVLHDQDFPKRVDMDVYCNI